MLVRHYIKIAFRNFGKYKLQTAISILGLAIGFACFTLSVLWIRYELTFDTFHQDAERIYLVQVETQTSNSGLSYITPSPLAGHLKETFPEIEKSCNMGAWETDYKFNGKEEQTFIMQIDSAAMGMSDIRLLSGSNDFMQQESNDIAISDRLAQKLFGSKNPLGMEIEFQGNKRRIGAIVQGWSEHSNLPFGLLDANLSQESWNISGWQTFIKIKPDIDVERFKKKLYKHIIEEDRLEHTHFVLTPITHLRYENPIKESTVNFEHIQLFAIAGGLVILCSLFNYLTLFVNRIQIRTKEIGLRKVSGSSNIGLMKLLATEYLLTLLLALLCGMILIEIILPYFKEVSGVTTTVYGIYMEVLLYAALTIVLSLLLSGVLLYSFRKQSLLTILKGGNERKGKNIFSRVSLTIQLAISIGFIFCSSVLIKQIHHLNTTDLGFEREGRAVISPYPEQDGLREELSRLPFITEIFQDTYNPLFPSFGQSYRSVREWDEKPASIESITLSTYPCNRAYFEFYKLQLLQGKLPDDNSPGQILINETAAKEMGFSNPIGKTITQMNAYKFVISGIVKDFYLAPPTIPAKPALLDFSPNENNTKLVLFKYKGEWQACRKQLEALVRKMNPNVLHISIFSVEEEYQKFWKSESMLLHMLDFVSFICVLISLFGIFSQVTLDCEQYRKEIAVRKINGASVGSIIRIFFHKYIGLLCLASIFTFPVGYFIMKAWIENYVIQTTISWWLYPVIWLGLALVLTLCTLWRIQKAANQNPAEVIKSE